MTHRAGLIPLFLFLLCLAGCNRGNGWALNRQPAGSLSQQARQFENDARGLHSQLLSQVQQLQGQTNQLASDKRSLELQLQQTRQKLEEQVAQNQKVFGSHLPAEQYANVERRASELDARNQGLNTQLAQSRQELERQRELVSLLQERLGETAAKLRDTQVAQQESEQKIQALQASAQRRGGATITANNSLTKNLQAIAVEGLEVRQDGDVVRIEIPAEQIFQPSSTAFSPAANNVLDQIAAAITANYPRQLIGIEGHTDSTPMIGGLTAHQFGAAQSLAVFDQFTRRNRLPPQQFFTMSQGGNSPRFSNTTPAGRSRNRRVEVVIYPETLSDS